MLKNNIAIIDYGMGNLRSVYKALERAGSKAEVTSDKEKIRKSDKIIIPGVGHFAHGMERLISLGLVDILNEEVIERKKPVLGICLGMQLMTNHSEEGNINGLGWIDAQTLHFDFNNQVQKLKIPHMGWNTLVKEKGSSIFNNNEADEAYYFVHSYYVKCNNRNDVLCSANYGLTFTAAFEHNNILGMQYHPEKSHHAGIQLLRNFISLN